MTSSANPVTADRICFSKIFTDILLTWNKSTRKTALPVRMDRRGLVFFEPITEHREHYAIPRLPIRPARRVHDVAQQKDRFCRYWRLTWLRKFSAPGLPFGWFVKHKANRPVIFRRDFSLKSPFCTGRDARFCSGRGLEEHKKRRFSPKSSVYSCNSFVSMGLAVRVGHTGRATCTDREFLEILCETHPFGGRMADSLRSLPGGV